MASTSELWAIAQAKAKNPMAEGATRALSGIYGGYQKAETEDKQLLEKKLKELQFIQKVMAFKAMEQEMTNQRAGALNKITAGVDDNTNSGKAASMIAFPDTPEGRRLNKLTEPYMKAMGNTAGIEGKREWNFSDNPSLKITQGTDLDEDYKRSGIKANEALARERDEKAKDKARSSGSGSEKLGALIDKAIKSTQKELGDSFLDEETTKSLQKRLDRYNRANELYIAGDVNAAQKLMKESEQVEEDADDSGSSDKVLVTNPQGVKGYIPRSQLKSALSQGYKEAK